MCQMFHLLPRACSEAAEQPGAAMDQVLLTVSFSCNHIFISCTFVRQMHQYTSPQSTGSEPRPVPLIPPRPVRSDRRSIRHLVISTAFLLCGRFAPPLAPVQTALLSSQVSLLPGVFKDGLGVRSLVVCVSFYTTEK